MKKKYLSILALVCIIIHACQENPNVSTLNDVKPINYNFNVLNTLEFNFQQKSESVLKVIPYSNSFTITNVGDTQIEALNLGIYAFSKKDTFSSKNISFINNMLLSNLEVGSTSNIISLSNNEHLFNDDNLIISIENFNNQNHSLSGSYKGEINIYDVVIASADTTKVFSKSFLSRGTIDYRGRFYFLIEDSNETNISYLRGNFNTSDKVTGHIKTNVNTNYSTIQTEVLTDKVQQKIELIKDMNGKDSILNGDLFFTNNNQQHLLEFNLNKQK